MNVTAQTIMGPRVWGVPGADQMCVKSILRGWATGTYRPTGFTFLPST
jgi:TM2 domain-containing membrane protein YozV